MLNRLLLSLVLAPAVACGGGDSPTPTPIDTPPPTPDSPPAPVACPADGLGTQMAIPIGPMCGDGTIQCDFYNIEDTGPNTGTNKLEMGVLLSDGGENVGAGNDVIIYQILSPFILNTPVNWLTDAAASETASYAAATFLLNSENGVDVERLLWATNGSATITSTSEAPGGVTNVTMTNVTYKEVDDAGAVVAGGCEATVGIKGFALTNGNGTFQKPKRAEPGSREETLLRNASDKIARIQALRAQ